ncbi:ASCH domain-containing protein [Staphylococcus casei]|uniref:ASCH domain-containing protein n=1 Tax=Staphylococcus TaxID=1279 RepID=UPI0025711EF2|nr:ASCH domain-containing protein [Staphylococcus casei]WJE86881.1 ASCH domain-containing protein [Staphylococcus casei]
MDHNMKLYDKPFQLIENGSKTIEVRLNDKKRQEVQAGDFIIFENIEKNQSIKVEVLKVIKYMSFQALLQAHSNKELGMDEKMQLSQKLAQIYQIYNQTDEIHYGALAFKIRVVPK